MYISCILVEDVVVEPCERTLWNFVSAVKWYLHITYGCHFCINVLVYKRSTWYDTAILAGCVGCKHEVNWLIGPQPRLNRRVLSTRVECREMKVMELNRQVVLQTRIRRHFPMHPVVKRHHCRKCLFFNSILPLDKMSAISQTKFLNAVS